MWDSEKETCETTLNGHKKAVTVLRYNNTGSLLASGSKDNDIILWDVVGETGLFRLRGHRDQIYFPTKLGKNEFFECKFTLGSHYNDVCAKIVSFLNANEMEQLVERTQFSNLIRFANDYMNSNQLLWFLMNRQTYDSGSDELWMVYRKRPLRFSLLEYCLITGLNCSKIYPAIPDDDAFRVRHFGDRVNIFIADLKDRMDEYENGTGEADVEKLKLASLFFVAAILGPQRKSKHNDILNPEWMRLVESLESFNNYPWGRLAYEEAVFGLRKDLNDKYERYQKLAARRKNDRDFSGCGSFHITGFIHPLQILAYECFPSVAEAFATRRDGPNVAMPRMCHWLTKKWKKNHSPSIMDVTRMFSSVPDEVELVCRVATMILLINHDQLVATVSSRPALSILKDILHLRIKECKDTLGVNLAAMEHLMHMMATKSDAFEMQKLSYWRYARSI